MDELKKHILQHADEMNFDVPDSALWDKIESELEPPVRQLFPGKLIRFAAAACVIVLAGIGVWQVTNNRSNDTSVAEVKKKNDIQTPELIDSSKLNVQTLQPIEEKITQDSNNSIEQDNFTASLPKKTKKAEPAIAVARSADPNTMFIAEVNKMSASFISVVNLQRKELSKTPIYGESGDYYSDFKAQFYQLEKEEQDLKKQMSKSGPADNSLQRLIDIYQQKINILKQLQNEINKTNSRYKLSRPDDKTVSKQFLHI